MCYGPLAEWEKVLTETEVGETSEIIGSVFIFSTCPSLRIPSLWYVILFYVLQFVASGAQLLIRVAQSPQYYLPVLEV